MENRYFLVIDRGQTEIKAAVTDVMANVLFVESCKCEPIQSKWQGWAEQDMNRIWEQAVHAIREVLHTSGVSPRDIAAISFAGQGGGNFLVSGDGKAMYPGVVSMDARHEELQADFTADLSGIPRTLTFMAWLKKHEPDVFCSTKWLLGSKDWIRYCMAGVANADLSDAAAPVDLEAGVYKTEALDILGIPECAAMLPPLKYASELCGTVTQEAAKATGLLEGTPVVMGAHDMIACSAGAGGCRQGHLAIIMGTLGINIAVVGAETVVPEKTVPGERFLFGGIAKGTRTMTTSIGSAGSTMDYFVDLLFSREKLEAEAKGRSVFGQLESMLNAKRPSEVIFQPYLMGTFYNSAARAGFLGISAQTKREDLLMAVYEGICISLCMEIGKLEPVVGAFDDIWLVGGGSKSKIWGQMFADVLNKPVHISKTSELGCRGAAICAGMALNLYTMEDGFPSPEIAHTYLPRAAVHELYAQKMEAYRNAYQQSMAIWSR